MANVFSRGGCGGAKVKPVKKKRGKKKKGFVELE